MPFIKNSILYNPFKGNEEKEILIFDHPRKTLFQNEYKDIYYWVDENGVYLPEWDTTNPDLTKYQLVI